jgi:glycosyltransferase involved in cell wall biosynthesis
MTQRKAILLGPLPPPYGGVSVVMTALKDVCIPLGVEVLSYAGDGGDGRVIRVNHRLLGHLIRILKLPKGTRITDSTHFHLEYPHWLLLPLWLLVKKVKRFTWVKLCHDGSIPFRYDKMGHGAKRRMAAALDSIDEFIVSSPNLVTFFQKRYGRPIRYVSPLLSVKKTSGISSRHPLDGDGEVSIISVGTFIPSYGFHEVAEAVEGLRKRGRRVKLCLLDAGFARSGSYRDVVLAERPWITVYENVPHEQVGRYFSQNDIFVRSFAHEAYGLSRVEALFAGLPVIATDIGETRGMLTYHAGDIGALERQIESVITSWAPADQAKWIEVYSREAEEAIDIYTRVVTGDDMCGDAKSGRGD